MLPPPAAAFPAGSGLVLALGAAIQSGMSCR
jgi:hypothetical protein